MPPAKRPAAPAPSPQKKGMDFNSPGGGKKARQTDPNVVDQFLMRQEGSNTRIYFRIGQAGAQTLKQAVNDALHSSGICGAQIYRADVSSKGDCVQVAVYSRMAVTELQDTVSATLSAPLTLGVLGNPQWMPESKIDITTHQDYVKVGGDAWRLLKKWLLGSSWLAGQEAEDGTGVIFSKTEDFDEEYWVNSLKSLCDSKGFEYTMHEAYGPKPRMMRRAWHVIADSMKLQSKHAQHAHTTHVKHPYWLITADEAKEAYNLKQARRHKRHPQQDLVQPAWLQKLIDEQKMNDDSLARMMDSAHICKTVGAARYLMKYMVKDL